MLKFDKIILFMREAWLGLPVVLSCFGRKELGGSRLTAPTEDALACRVDRMSNIKNMLPFFILCFFLHVTYLNLVYIS